VSNKYRRLCAENRKVIANMNQAGRTQSEIAQAIGFGQSTICKELSRNHGERGYRPAQTERLATERKSSKRTRPKVMVGIIKDEVEAQLRIKHSPDQISKSLALLALLVGVFSHGKTPAPEDALAKPYWSSLNESTKPVFLAGFRHGWGPGPHDPALPTLQAGQIPKLIPLLDRFYQMPANDGLYLKLAIQICLMELNERPQAEIEAFTKSARDTVYNHD
jgi:hypothetical protein